MSMKRHANIDDLLDSLRSHSAEQQYLMDVLALWRHAAKAGYSDEEIKAFSFRPQFLTVEEEWRLGRSLWDQEPCDTHFNCVRLKNGDLKQIPLYPRPQQR